jgi:D-alanyl-D-alanine carboxypeptidase/D-alanyl-D-alanine-endopeptidase (penicillin-binding protein 4)
MRPLATAPLTVLATRSVALLAALVVVLATATAAPAAGGGGLTGPTSSTPQSAAMTRGLNAGMRQAGIDSGAEVVDLTTGAVLYDHADSVARIPASVEKLYTTSTALERFGSTATVTTALLGQGARVGATWRGALYLRGGGDPTFGSAAFDRRAYGTGATVQALVAGLRADGIRTVTGPIVADASLFDGDKGTPATDNQPSIDVEGALSALAFNRDWADSDGEVYWAHPALEAGDQLRDALRAAGIRVSDRTARIGRTPAGATPLASVRSPTIATLIALTNTPSDNFFAEMLLKDIGAHFGTGGTTAAGAAVVRSTIAAKFGLHPFLIDGSGLSYRDRTSPAQVISLLSQMAGDSSFRNSLATVGRSGTLALENRDTYAQGRCTGKTGTLSDVSNVVGYCRAQDGNTLAYAFLMNGVDPDAAHLVQDRMEVAVARYDG